MSDVSEKELDYLDALIKQGEEAQQTGQVPAYYPTSSGMFNGSVKQNTVEWQLDFTPELIKIARLLRGDISVIDPNTNKIMWVKNPDSDKVFLNDLGVTDILRKVFLYLNKNLVLSTYNPEEVRLRVRQIGHELRAQIYNNYEAYGIDNEYKMNNFAPIVIDVLQTIESAYRRAISGEERRGLNEIRYVNQNDNTMSMPMGGYPGMGQMGGKGKNSLWKPWTWGK